MRNSGGKQLIWGTGYPRPRWELPMDKELAFVDSALDFYSIEDRELILGKNACASGNFRELSLEGCGKLCLN